MVQPQPLQSQRGQLQQSEERKIVENTPNSNREQIEETKKPIEERSESPPLNPIVEEELKKKVEFKANWESYEAPQSLQLDEAQKFKAMARN